MNTDIEYLKQLEQDLKDAAVREAARGERAAATPARRRPGQMWMRAGGVAAAFIVIAGAIGFVVGPNASDKFQQVGDAVSSGGSGDGGSGAGGGAIGPADLGYGTDASGESLNEAPVAAPPSPAPATDEAARELGSLGEGWKVTGDSLGDVGAIRVRPLQDLSKIIRDGRIGVVVDDGTFEDNVDQLTLIAEGSGGFILSSSTRNERSGTFVLRIPERRFDRAMGQIRDLGTVRFQEVTGEDVTAEFIDLQARLTILQERRALLFGLLQDATTTEEILRLSSQLDDVQLRIEQMQGHIRFINDQVAEATLRVTITERNAPASDPDPRVDNPDLGSSWDLAIQGFLRIVGAVIIGLGYLIPLAVLAAIVWAAVWFARRRRMAA